MTAAPHHGDGSPRPIEIKHERKTLREILMKHLEVDYDGFFHDTVPPCFPDLERDLLAMIRSREALVRERCAALVEGTVDPGEVVVAAPRFRKAAGFIRAMRLPCEEKTP